MTKRCARCGRDKDVESFNLNQRYRDGYQSYCKACHREYDLLRKYGIDAATFDAMLIAQSGRCVICEDQLVDPRVDHCHATNIVRALLCNTCNTALGVIESNPVRHRAMIAYLTQHQLTTSCK